MSNNSQKAYPNLLGKKGYVVVVVVNNSQKVHGQTDYDFGKM